MRPVDFKHRPKSMWRYVELLPVSCSDDVCTLGEGMTPLIPLARIAARKGLLSLKVKDESHNPTESFKARGMSAAVSAAKRLKLTKLAVPTAGNAGVALAAYAARAGLDSYIFMPKDSPPSNVIACEVFGAKVTLLDGLIHDCAAALRVTAAQNGWFDMSTLREPYRIEGKKTIAFELAEQLNWQLPSVIICPTGGGSAIIGIWKGIMELRELGWITGQTPKMISVQSEGCSPIFNEFSGNRNGIASQDGVNNRPSGLRVPRPFGKGLIVDILRSSGGGAVAVTEAEIIESIRQVGALEGIFVCPEGAATVAALDKLLATNLVKPEDDVVLLNTGSGSKYSQWLAPPGRNT